MQSSVDSETYYISFFFFQAEDGIRDLTVTGVQTCAFRSRSQRVFGYLITFGMKRLEDWKADRQRQVRAARSEEHTSELQSQSNLVCRLLLEKKKKKN